MDCSLARDTPLLSSTSGKCKSVYYFVSNHADSNRQTNKHDKNITSFGGGENRNIGHFYTYEILKTTSISGLNLVCEGSGIYCQLWFALTCVLTQIL